ncbi:caspase family protein [Amycolatopsis sp. NPDC021455]|uniref:caspase family protein n=1 Tax=Amycolatopsis sp. NPDC021455 TaxID=3154901 RepID=UPI0033FFF57A
MKSRALLIGGKSEGLLGIGHDVDTMATLMDARGFEIRRCDGDTATRAGILAEYERLIADTEAGDRAVVYYSGHGGLEPPVLDGPDPRPGFQFLVPADFHESTPTDVRVITAVELSVNLALLTLKTTNCTVILDCCHAAHMSRDPRLRPKAMPNPVYLNIAAHLERLIKAGLRVDLPDPIGNRQAVRMVACSPWQFAYEYENAAGQSTGLFTESLRIALSEADGLPVSWAAVVSRIRDRMRYLAPDQRPEVEGEGLRRLFETGTADPAGAVPVSRSGSDHVRLPGARLSGSGVGDTYAILPAGVAEVVEDAVIAIATVDRIGDGVEAALTYRSGHTEIPVGAQAHLLTTTAPRWPVLVSGAGEVADQLRAALAAVPTLRPVPGDDADARAAVAEVDVADQLCLRDAAGPLSVPKPAGADGIAGTVANAKLLAKAAALRGFSPRPADALDAGFGAEWGRVVAGSPRPLPESGAVLHEGEMVYLRVRNDSDRRLFFFAFNLALDGAVELVNDADQSGIGLDPGQDYVLGALTTGELVGMQLSWPPAAPRGIARPEFVSFVVSSVPEELGVLAQSGVRDVKQAERVAAEVAVLRDTGSPLQRALALASIGGSRGFGKEPRGPERRYAARQFDYLLSPLPAPAEEAVRFLLDERPSRSVRLLAPGGAPATATVRLEQLIVHRTGRLGGDLRVDGLVITAGPDGLPVHRFTTTRFAGVKDGDELTLGDVPAYAGPVGRYLDLAWWISPDTGGPELAAQLEHRFSPDEFRRAAEALAEYVPAQPEAAAPVAATGAAAAIVNAVAEVLPAAGAGLYRTTLLPDSGFGTGRHPAGGAVPVADFSFAYRVTTG